MQRTLIGMLLLLLAAQARSAGSMLEVEVLEASQVSLADSAGIGYAVVHHKHDKDQAQLSAWLHQHAGARVTFETADGTAHAAVLQRLKHCFGRGLLLYRDAVALKDKAVIRLRLEALPCCNPATETDCRASRAQSAPPATPDTCAQ